MKNERIAEVLKRYRKKNNLTVHEVSMLLHDRCIKAADKTIYGWESGHTQPSADTLLVLCDIYHIDNILNTFGYTDYPSYYLSRHENVVIEQYRRHPEFHEAIDTLLGIR